MITLPLNRGYCRTSTGAIELTKFCRDGDVEARKHATQRMRKLCQFSKPRPTRTSSRELSYMNPSSKDDSKSNQETQAFDPPLIQEEEVVHPAPDDEGEESAEKSEPAQIEQDKERAETVTKEAMLRVTGGQL
jgi:hypothetical protein